MKKNNCFYIVALLCGILLLGACTKDKGTYTLTPINELSFKTFDTLQGYRVNLGDTLRIDPGVVGTRNDHPSESDYSYEWRLVLAPADDRVISTSKKLEAPITYKPGSYVLTLRVKDNTTGVTWLGSSTVNIITPIYEGFLVLNNVNDTARLDFLSYNSTANTFSPYINVQEKLGVPMAPAAQPYQVSFQYTTAGGSYLFLLTDKATWLLDPETFAYNPDLTLSALVSGPLPAGFRAKQTSFKRYSLTFLMSWMFSDNDVVHATGPTSFTFISSPANYYTGSNQYFKPAPFRVVDELGSRIVLYDQTNRRFATFTNGAYTADPIDPLLNFPTGKDMVYMADDGGYIIFGSGLKAYAVLKDPGQPNYYMLRFSYVGNPFLAPPVPTPDYNEALTGTDIASAEHFAVSPNLGYLFYNVGGKLYEYDLFLRASKLMLDLGNEKISYINFDLSASGTTDMKNWLIVGSYDPAGKPGENGKLGLYEVPPVNGALNKKFEWSGMGQVVSVSYRYRK